MITLDHVLLLEQKVESAVKKYHSYKLKTMLFAVDVPSSQMRFQASRSNFLHLNKIKARSSLVSLKHLTDSVLLKILYFKQSVKFKTLLLTTTHKLYLPLNNKIIWNKIHSKQMKSLFQKIKHSIKIKNNKKIILNNNPLLLIYFSKTNNIILTMVSLIFFSLGIK